MPLDDRAADTWEPLFAVADLAGGRWPAAVYSAALRLNAYDETDTSSSARLPADLQEVFGDAEALHTETILGALRKISEAPWDDYFGRPLTARDPARLLKPYGVASVDVKLDGVNKKGYRRNHLHDPWTRYLPGECDMGATSATSATEHVNMSPELTSDVAQVAQVAEVSHASSFCDEVDRAFPDWRRMAGETGP